MIVADTNLVAYLLIEGAHTALAILTLQQAHETWHAALSVFGESEVEPEGDDVLDHAAERNLSAYDAQFVVAASDLDVPLVTSDRRMLAACADIALSPEQFLRATPNP